MKQKISSVPLFDIESGQFREADLFRGVDTATLKSIEFDWAPAFASVPSEKKPEDAHWEWADKATYAAQNALNYELFGIEADGKTQGLMLAIKGGLKCFSRHPDHPQAPLIYIDFLATAPWNRPSLVTKPAYKGVGRVLFMTAVSLSFQEELAGRVGLHSLPGAESFYRNQFDMTDLGKDVEYLNLRYFELSAIQVQRLMSSGL